MQLASVELNGVKVYRNNRLTLNIKHLTIPSGELVAVAGPNGAGKSTLLQVINMLLPYQQGTLNLFGEVMNRQGERDAARRQSSMMFQEMLLVNGTVYENVALPLTFRQYPQAQIRELVMTALQTFQCQHLAGRQARQLSGGEAQRVGLARALVFQPQLLLLDEPFAALDTASRTAILSDLKQVAKQNQLTVVLISHNFNDVLNFADRVIVLADGAVIQDDKPEAVLRRPATREVASLVDMDNVLPCQIEAGNAKTIVRLDGGVAFTYNRSVINRAEACCLPGDAIYILNENASLPEQPLVTVRGRVAGITPGIGTYKMNVATDRFSLIVRVPREQTLGLMIGERIAIGFSPDEVQLI
jgi:tungstate transport system ATP-binding protein